MDVLKKSSESVAFAMEMKKGELLQPLTEIELQRCLPFGGQCLSGFDSGVLPHIPKDHDLVEALQRIVVKDVSPHPKKPATEMMSTILNTSYLTQVVFNEMKKFCISMKTLSTALEMNPATFSLGLREPRHWFDANHTQKRCYYNLFLWLNLPLSFRKGCFKQFGPKPQPDDEILLNASDEENCPVAEIPRVQKLSLVFLRELLAHKITINHFSNIVLGGKDSFLVRNMLMAPLTWDMTPVKLRKMYGKIWYWMRMPIDQRLKCLGMAPKLQAEEVALAEESCEEEDAIEEPMTDTTIISKVVIQRLTESDMKVSQLAQSLLPGLPPLYLNDYLFNPIDWTTATPHQRYVYAMLNYWLGNEEDLFAGVYLNTRQVASEALRFVKQNGVTISEFADRVVKIPRASVSLYFNNTIEWNASKDYLKHAYVLTAHWLDLPPEARLRGFTSNVTKQPRIENVEVKPDINHDNDENASVARPEIMAQEAAILQEAKVLLTKKPPKVMSFINTAGVAADMRAEMKRAGVSINGFAGVLGVHRNLLSALLQNPVSWDQASQYQQFAYGAMKQWLLFRQGQVVIGQQNSNNALKPINGPFHSKRVKQQRVRFTPEQRRYLSAAFKANPRPSADEKRAIGETLGLPFKTVTIYYSNARSRSSSSAASPY